MGRKMIRVFPRKTKATPDDERVFFHGPEKLPLWLSEETEVMVSCTFTWDKPKAEHLAAEWERAGFSVSLGGPAYDDPGSEFVPGRFLRPGYVLTSRGCNNRCWFCSTWQREGNIRELRIREGWDVLDSNLLQCSESHIRAVFAMLNRQPQKIKFSGGLEAAILKDWHVELLVNLKPRIKRIYFAYDEPDDYVPLVIAAMKLREAGLLNMSRNISVYVLCGYPGDEQEQAQKRLESVLKLNLVPFVMLYCDDSRNRKADWMKFIRLWRNRKWMFGKFTKLRDLRGGKLCKKPK